MSDPIRITSREWARTEDDLGADLLRSARSDGPSPAAMRCAAMALGLGGVAGATATAAAATAASSKAAVGGATVLLAKWIGVGVVGVVIAVGAAKYVGKPETTITGAASPSVAPRPDSTHPTRAAIPGNAPPTPNATPFPNATPTPAPFPPPNATPIPAPSTPPNATSAHASAPPGVAPAASSLAEELHALDRARSALAAGDARAALDALDAHDRAFQGGALAPEAAVLRIEALERNGDLDGAIAQANAFLAAFPDSAQERRVRSVLEAALAKKKL